MHIANRNGCISTTCNFWTLPLKKESKYLLPIDNECTNKFSLLFSRAVDSVPWAAGSSTSLEDSCCSFLQGNMEIEQFVTIEPLQDSQQTTSTPLPSPILDMGTSSSSFSESKSGKKNKKSVEEIYEDTSKRLIALLEPVASQPTEPTVAKYQSAVVDFIVETLGKLSKEEADACEKELMKVATKFRYNF